MKKPKQAKHFIKKPIYPGGIKAIRQFIKEHLKYPEEALSNKIEGAVRVSYAINHQGKVIRTKITSSLGYGCNEEAERLVRLLKFEVPKNRGVKVTFHKKISINFRLPKTKPKKQVLYHYKESPQTSKNGYTITIPYPKS